MLLVKLIAVGCVLPWALARNEPAMRRTRLISRRSIATVIPETKGGAVPGVGALHQFATVVAGAKAHLSAAAVARGVSIFAMFPVDTIKTRTQMGMELFPGAGFQRAASLYTGCAGNIMFQVPYGVFTFGSYEIYKQTLQEKFPDMKLGLRTFLAAVAGDMTGSLWLCPTEVMKIQLQSGLHPNLPAAMSSIWKQSGLRGFYRGYGAQISRDVPFRVIQLMSYEFVKAAYLKFSREESEEGGGASAAHQPLAAWEGMVVGAIAGSFSAALTTPLDVLKTRMMTGNAHGATSVLQAVQRISAAEGTGALFKGLAPRVAYIGPSCAIFFMVYEHVHALCA